MSQPLILGAVAYAPKVVTIWEGFKSYLGERGFAMDYILYSNYETQVEAQFKGDVAFAWNSPLAWVRAARMAPGFDLLDFAARFHGAAGLLLDTHAESYGGSGKVFDWSLIPPSVPLPVVLSGGLSPANVTDGVLRVRPWAVDVSSGVEVSKGVKSGPLMRRFCKAVREADDRLNA